MLAVLTTHPIQYQVPMWKKLAERGNVPFKVFYMSDQGSAARFDPGFGRTLAWDLDLLNGYDNEFVDTRTGTQQDSFWWLSLKRGFDRRLRDNSPRVLWVQGWQVAAYWQAVWLAKRLGIQTWLRGETNLRSNAGGPFRPLKRALLKQFFARVDQFLCIGDLNRQFYRHFGIDPQRLTTAPYCVENRRFASQASEFRVQRSVIRGQWAIPEDAFCFLFVGKLISKKRPFDLVAAARRLRELVPHGRAHLLWVGSGELGDALRAECTIDFDSERKLASAVPSTTAGPPASFVGFLNQNKIAKAYAAADCLVLPSEATETWGLVVNEAMACGLPAVVSDACGCSEDLVRPSWPDLCYPVGNIAALARAMAKCLTDCPKPELVSAWIANYDYLHTVEAVETLYARASSTMV